MKVKEFDDEIGCKKQYSFIHNILFQKCKAFLTGKAFPLLEMSREV
jgi:hypothetical protein